MQNNLKEPNMTNKMDSESILALFFRYHGLANQQLTSYNTFVSRYMRDIIRDLDTIVWPSVVKIGNENYLYKLYVTYKDIALEKPLIVNTLDDNKDSQLVTFYPQMARLMGVNYDTMTHIIMEFRVTRRKTLNDVEEEVKTKQVTLPFFRLPIMVRSDICSLSQFRDDNSNTGFNKAKLASVGECTEEQGGYFIINGGEKAVIAQEKMSPNYIFTFKNNKSANLYENIHTEVRSSSTIRSRVVSRVTLSFVQSKMPTAGYYIRISFPAIHDAIPVIVAFRALGVMSEEEIIKLIIGSDEIVTTEKSELNKLRQEIITLLRPSFDEAHVINCVNNAIIYISNHLVTVGSGEEARLNRARNVIENEFLPHVATLKENKHRAKSIFLANMIAKHILVALDQRKPDDRDHMMFKRAEVTGMLMGSLFRQLMIQADGQFKGVLGKQVENDSDFAKIMNNPMVLEDKKSFSFIGSGICYALGNGNWTADKTSKARNGVSQPLSRITFMASVSHLRRINSPIGRDSKISRPRQLHNTHFGFMCPAETPEGEACGLLKNFASTCLITDDLDPVPYLHFIESSGNFIPLHLVDAFQVFISTKIFLNGDLIGITPDTESADELIKKIITLRRSHSIHWSVNVFFDKETNELHVSTDAGRFIRPLLIVKDGNLLITNKMIQDSFKSFSENGPLKGWAKLYSYGVIEFIDASESEMCRVAFYPNQVGTGEFTHCEIHPSAMLGIVAAQIPFPDHTQSPRNTYQCSMAKQSLGIYATNFSERMDSLSHELMFTQKPMASTKIMRASGLDNISAGTNIMLAIMTYTGFNQEDANVLNRSSVERGLFNSLFHRTYKDEEKIISGNKQEYIEYPRGIISPIGSYAKLDENGIVKLGSMVDEGDVIIGKTIEVIGGDGKVLKKDVSMTVKATESGIIDMVKVNRNSKGLKVVKIRVKKLRVPQLGDKYACYTADHEVLTTEGMIPIDCITTKHKVASLVGGKLIYQHPTDIVSYDCDDALYEVNSKDVSLRVTSNHRMYVKTMKMEKYEIKIAETLHHIPTQYKKDVDEWIPEHVGTLYENIDRKSERMPQWVWNLDRAKCKKLVNSLLEETSSTFYPRFADDFQRLCLHAGCVADKIEFTDITGIKKWRLKLSQEKEPLINIGKKFNDKFIITEVPVKVYCCTVPGEGLIYVRRFGKGVWCGNTRNSQKSTTGLQMRQEDMPFTNDGTTPDMIMNSCAISSRMTIGQLLETLISKAGTRVGEIADCTPFEPETTAERIGAILKANGYDKYGDEIMYDPITGKQLLQPIYIGPTYYQRLKHMPEDKLHSRSSGGPINIISHQPVEGRAKGGG